MEVKSLLVKDMNKKRCVIISASPTFFNEIISPADYIIACDGGYLHAKKSGIKPDLVVGDFDSYHGEIYKNITVITAPSEKDDTDTMLAVKLGLEMGIESFLLLGATGGRIDHFLANISTATYIASHGGICEIADKYNRIFAIKDSSIEIIKRENCSISVFSYTDKSDGVTLKGLKYPMA